MDLYLDILFICFSSMVFEITHTEVLKTFLLEFIHLSAHSIVLSFLNLRTRFQLLHIRFSKSRLTSVPVVFEGEDG